MSANSVTRVNLSRWYRIETAHATHATIIIWGSTRTSLFKLDLRKFNLVYLGYLSSTSHCRCWSTSHSWSQLLLLQRKPGGENITLISVVSIPIKDINGISIDINIKINGINFKQQPHIISYQKISFQLYQNISLALLLEHWLCVTILHLWHF